MELQCDILCITHTHTLTHMHAALTHTHTHMHSHAASHTHAHTHAFHMHIALFEKAEVLPDADERKPNHLVVAISSDRGLCGGIHSNVAKSIKTVMQSRAQSDNTAIVCVGDKARVILQRTLSKNIMMTFNEIGRKPPVFAEAVFIAQQILDSGFEYESAELVFNRFR